LAPKNTKPVYPFILLGLLYFSIASFNYNFLDVDNFFIKEFFRLLIVVTFGAAIVGQTNIRELYIVILIGTISIFINALIFPEMSINIGRAAGFYLNANMAGALCVIGYGFSYGIKEKTLRIIGQMVFTLGGVLTFSRTFIVIWLFLNLIAIYRSKKNMLAPVIGVIALLLVFTFAEELTLDKQRFSAFQSFLERGDNRSAQTLQEGSRDETWAQYYDLVMEKPWIGHGFMSFQKPTNNKPGAHNTYLMIIGESGIIPFLLHIGIYTMLFIKSLGVFKSQPEYINITIGIILYMLTSHTYFVNFYLILISMYVYVHLKKEQKFENLKNTSE
jgi:O-antigen ligase